jgi:hypothetical protein
MFRVSLANAAAKRTCKPLYEKHQATPHATFLDPSETRRVYSGMVMRKSGADTVRLMDGAVADVAAFGLSALDYNDVIDDLDGLDIRPWAVWQGGPDAEFIVEAPAFDDAETYAVPTTGVPQLLYAGTGAAIGKLTSAVNGPAVAELLEVVSATRLRIRLFAPTGLPA